SHVIARLVGFERAPGPGSNIGDGHRGAAHRGPILIDDAAQDATLIGLRRNGQTEDHHKKRDQRKTAAQIKLAPTRIFHKLTSSEKYREWGVGNGEWGVK